MKASEVQAEFSGYGIIFAEKWILEDNKNDRNRQIRSWIGILL